MRKPRKKAISSPLVWRPTACDHADTAAKTPMTKSSVRPTTRTTVGARRIVRILRQPSRRGPEPALSMGRHNGLRGSLRLTSCGRFRIDPRPWAAEIATTLLLKSADVTILSCICWTLDPI